MTEVAEHINSSFHKPVRNSLPFLPYYQDSVIFVVF